MAFNCNLSICSAVWSPQPAIMIENLSEWRNLLSAFSVFAFELHTSAEKKATVHLVFHNFFSSLVLVSLDLLLRFNCESITSERDRSLIFRAVRNELRSNQIDCCVESLCLQMSGTKPILSTSRRPILKSLESCLIMDISSSRPSFDDFTIGRLRNCGLYEKLICFSASSRIEKLSQAPRGWALVRLICMKIVTKILTTRSFPTDLTRRVSLGVLESKGIANIRQIFEKHGFFEGLELSAFLSALLRFLFSNFRDIVDLGSAVSRIMTSQRSCQEPGDQINWFGNGRDECLKFQVALIIWSVYWWGLRWFEYCALDWFVPVIYDLSETTENNKAVQY